MQYFSSLSHLIHVVHKYRACSSKFVCEKLTPKNVSNTTSTILLGSFFTLHLITLHPGLSFTKRICKGDFLFQQCAKNCLLAHLGITLPPYPQIGKIVFDSSSVRRRQGKGSFHSRFSGIRPLRGGGLPPFSAKEKNLLFFTLIFR